MTARQPHPPSPLDRLPLRDRVASGRAGAQQSLVEIIFTRRKLLNLTAPQILRARAFIVTNQTLPTAHGMSQYVWRTPKSQGSFYYSVRTSTHASDVPLYDGSSTNFGSLQLQLAFGGCTFNNDHLGLVNESGMSAFAIGRQYCTMARLLLYVAQFGH